MKRGDDDCSSLIHNIETGAYVDWDKPIWHTWLVKVMKCRVGDVRVKRDRGEVWIIICIKKIIIIIHIIKNVKKNKQIIKQKKSNLI